MATTAAPPRRRETLESAVIRFAGDSGDGMQITGSQFTNTTALFGNDLATFPDYPAEIRAPAGHPARGERLPGPLRRRRRHHPRRRGGRPRGHEPGRAEGEPGRPQEGRHPHRQRGRLQGDRPQEGRHRGEPARGPLARGVPRLPGRAHEAHPRRAAGDRPRLEEHGPVQELLRAGHVLLALQPLARRDAPVARRQVQGEAHPRRGQQAGAQGRLRLLRRDRGVPGQLRGPARAARAGRLPQPLRQQRARARLRGRLAAGGHPALPGQLPDHPGLRHPARAVDVQGVRRRHLPGRGRDRRHHLRHRRRLRGLARHHHDLGPRHGAQDRGDRPRHRWSSCRS